jgi:tetratricopeptide (TPR) repeat protein
MRRPRARIPTPSLLLILPLAFALPAGPENVPGFPALYDQAADSYEKADWARCGERFAAAAKAASLDRQAARALLRAAACAARSGDKDGAFRYLGEAAARGSRDADRIATDPDFEGLRSDPRWAPVVAGVRERDAASRKGPVNAELTRLYEEDQKDRAPDLGKIDWSVVAKRDEERRKRVIEIVARGGAKEASDFVHAAMVLQHGQAPDDFKQAHDWCVKAIEIDPDYPGARWLAAAAQDRYLMNLGKPQLYGTQFKRDDGGPWYLWEVDPSISDEERAKWDVPPLARAKARVGALNAETFQPH